MENQKPKTDPLVDSPVRYSFTVFQYQVDESSITTDFDSEHSYTEVGTFRDFVQKLYLVQQYCEEFEKRYIVQLSNSPSINFIKIQSNEIQKKK